MAFSEIQGQERAVTLLRRAIAKESIASGYLFCGPEGVGKARCALSLAQALECERRAPGDEEGCNACNACRKVLQGNHPDIYRVKPDGAFIKIEQIRELKSRLSLRAHEGKYKLAIIEDAERLHPTAANALLKTLEEPTADTRFVLLTKSPRFVLPTIRSRCQTVPFVPVQVHAIEDILLQRGVEPHAARVAARVAEGSVGRASRALEASDELKHKLALARSLEVAVQASDPSLGLKAAEELARGTDRQELLEVLDFVTLFYRDLVCSTSGAYDSCSHDPRPSPDEPRTEDGERLATRTALFTPTRALACVEALLQARDSISRNGNSLLVLENLVFSLRRYTGATRARART